MYSGTGNVRRRRCGPDYRLGIDDHHPRNEHTNEAARLSRRFIDHFTAGERDAWLKMLSPDQATFDRRPLIGIDTTGVDELAELYPRDETTRAMSSTAETIAVRGDDFALIRWYAVSGSGREWEAFHLTQWNADGLNVLNVIFPSDQLAEAIDELDRRYRDASAAG